MPSKSRRFNADQDKFLIKHAGEMTWEDIAAGIGGGLTAEICRKRHYQLRVSGAAPVEGESLTVETSGDGQSITSKDPDIRTVDDLLRHCNVDLTVWRVAKAVVNKWGGFARTMSHRDPVHGTAISHRKLTKVPLYQVKVWLERIGEDEKESGKLREKLIADMDRHSPRTYKVVRRPAAKRDGLMLELALPDAHFGKLAWGQETGESQDLKTINAMYRAAVHDLLTKAGQYPIAKIVYTIGNDLLHVDNHLNTTTGGTPQDVDSRWQKSFLYAKRALVDALDMCREIAPTEGVVVPGNHDRERCFYIGDTLASHYRHDTAVTIDNRPTLRKYVEWHNVLLGLTHGSEERHRDLPLIMAQEAPAAWARTSTGTREWHLGHLHKRSEVRFNAADTFNGVNVRVIPSLCSTDAWHHAKGYVGNGKLAEAYLWHPHDGYYGHIVHRGRAAA
jgi:hypothetical protein